MTIELRDNKQHRFFPNENGQAKMHVKGDPKIGETFVNMVSEEYAAAVDELQKVRGLIGKHAKIDNLE